SGDAAIAVGTFNTATGHRSTALGYEADALADDSVALGSESLADEANTVSVGREGFERRIVNVADGDLSATSTDAVNGRQLFGAMDAAAAALGGGAAVTAGGFVAPTYVIQGSSYNNVGAALDALDAKVTEIDGRVGTLEGNPVVASTDGDAPPTASSNGELDRSSGDAGNRVAGEPGSGDMASIMDGDSDKGGRPSVGGISTGGNQQVASNGGGSAAAVDADTKTYVDTTATETLSQANAYTDAKFAAWDDTFTAFQGEIDHRFAEQDRRIDKQGAMGAAMLNMATS